MRKDIHSISVLTLEKLFGISELSDHVNPLALDSLIFSFS